MPEFGPQSKENLRTCHTDIRRVLDEAIKYFDFSVTCGNRGRDAQDEAFYTNKSRTKYPFSKHNRYPSEAVDIAPYPIDWDDLNRFIYLAGVIRAMAWSMGINLRWGGDWDSDTQVKDNKFNDYGHFELNE